MTSVKPVQNKKGTPPNTAGFPKAVQNKKVSNKASVPSKKMGGKKGC